MAVKYVLQQQKDDMSGNGENYYFAKAVSTGEVNCKTICEDIFDHSVLEAIAIALLFVLNFIFGLFAGVFENRAKIQFQKSVQVYIRGIHFVVYSGISLLSRRSCRSERVDLFNDPMQQAYKTKWVVHCEPSLASAEHVVRRRFTLHILPQRFVKIRRLGIYNHTVKRNLKLQFVPTDIDAIIKQQKTPETTIERFQRLTGIDPCFARYAKKDGWFPPESCHTFRAPTWFMFNITHAHSL